MATWFPGYGPLGPAFWRNRSLIPMVAPVAPPSLPGHPGGSGTPAGTAASGPMSAWPAAAPPPGRQVIQAQPGSPLAALAHTSLGPALADLIRRAPQVGEQLAGATSGGMMPPDIPGMPKMPSPHPGLLAGPTAGLGGTTEPVQVPQWFVEQQSRMAQGLPPR